MRYDEFKSRYMSAKAKPRRKHGHPEEDIQAACILWFRLAYPRYIVFAAPNGGSRNFLEAVNLKRSGVLAGVSDLIIVADHTVMFVEMKTKTGKQSIKQKEFQANVERLGFEYKVCRSLSEFQQTINHWIKDKYAIK